MYSARAVHSAPRPAAPRWQHRPSPARPAPGAWASAPPPVAPPPPPRPVPAPVVVPIQQPATAANPFAFGGDESAAEPTREPARVVEAELAPEEPEPEPPRRTRPPAADPAGPWKIAV